MKVFFTSKLALLVIAGVINLVQTSTAALSGVGEKPTVAVGAWVKFPTLGTDDAAMTDAVQAAIVAGDFSGVKQVVKTFTAADITYNSDTKVGGIIRYCGYIPARPGQKITLKDATLSIYSSDEPSGGQMGNRLGTNQTWSVLSNFAFGINYTSDGRWSIVSVGQNNVPFDAIGVISDTRFFITKTASDLKWVTDNVKMMLGTTSVKEGDVDRTMTRSVLGAEGFTPPTVHPVVSNEAGKLVISFPTGGFASQFYQLQSTSNVNGGWGSASGDLTVANGLVRFTTNMAGTKGFFRVVTVTLK